jgi:hypothetical protein
MDEWDIDLVQQRTGVVRVINSFESQRPLAQVSDWMYQLGWVHSNDGSVEGLGVQSTL